MNSMTRQEEIRGKTIGDKRLRDYGDYARPEGKIVYLWKFKGHRQLKYHTPFIFARARFYTFSARAQHVTCMRARACQIRGNFKMQKNSEDCSGIVLCDNFF